MKVTIDEGLQIIEKIDPIKRVETLPIEEAINRVSAQDFVAKFDLPRFDNSAMDGYAVKLSDANRCVKVIDTILAGEDKDIKLEKNIAIKIMTGAKIPKGCEAVIPFEDVKIKDDLVCLPQKIKKDANIRKAGEDVKKEEYIVNIGEVLDSYKIGLLASQGYSYIKVFKKVKVGVFATGKELKMHFEEIKPHQIYNSNTPTFICRAKELNCEVTFLGTVEDDLEAIKELIKNSLDLDIIVTSGGVSVGEADFTKKAFLDLGAKIFFDKVEIKPGKPTTFGKIKDTYILNLPGNPLAAALNFEIFGRFLINRLSNKKDIYQNFIEAKLSQDIKNRPGREVVIPGFFDGKNFIPSIKRGPGMVSPLSKANGYIILDRDVELLQKESIVKFIPINFEFYSKTKKELFSR